MNGDTVLSEAVAAMGVSLAELVARCSIWSHPDIVREAMRHDRNAVWFPNCRRMKNGEIRRSIVSGIRLDDNSDANQAIKLATLGQCRILGFHACHVWPLTCYDPRYHTSIANLVLVPAALAGLTDFDDVVGGSLRRRAFELFGWHPEEEAAPDTPQGYPSEYCWRPSSPSPAALQALHRRPVLSAISATM